MTIQILVMGPGHVWRDEMVRCLQDQDMAVRTLDTSGGLARAIAAQTPDVILLSDQLTRDRMQSSSVDMLTLLQQAAPRVPVIMLGTGADSMEKIICLECGADDYVDMPCHSRELLSRIRNILRYRPQVMRSAIDLDGACAFGDFVFNRSRLHLTKDGVTVALQESAMSLLGKLAENPMKVLSRQALIEMLNGANCSVSRQRGGVSCERSLDVVVCRLRRVIESNPARPKFLQTVRSFGYVFNPSGADGSVRASDIAQNAERNLMQPTNSMRASQHKTLQKTGRLASPKAAASAATDGATHAATHAPTHAPTGADKARAINPWFSEISFPTRYPASEDLARRSRA